MWESSLCKLKHKTLIWESACVVTISSVNLYRDTAHTKWNYNNNKLQQKEKNVHRFVTYAIKVNLTYYPGGGGTDLGRGYRMCGPEEPLFTPLP